MPPNATRVPKLRLHKSSGRAVVTLNGRDIYLGRHGTPEARKAYERIVAEWLANGCRPAIEPHDGLTVAELCAAFRRHAVEHHVKPDGSITSRLHVIDRAIAALRPYDALPVTEFGPLKFRAVRQTWIDAGLARTTVNDYAAQVKLIFRWGVSFEMVPPAVHQALKAVPSLSRGRSGAKETEPVKPVPEAHVNAIREHVASPVWAMIQIQLLTGMRPGEIVQLRAIDLERSGDVWVYRPADHKTAWRNRERVILIGPQAQQVLQPFMLDRSLDAYCFSPREANAERKAIDAKGKRRENQKPSPRRTDRVTRDRYDAGGYRRAVERACEKAGVPKWTPHQLRHSAATRIRREAGVEMSRVLLGHSDLATTELYAERDVAAAASVVRRIG